VGWAGPGPDDVGKRHARFDRAVPGGKMRVMDSPSPPHPDAVLRFWFEELAPAQWWSGGSALDADIRQRFGAVLTAAARCELAHWRSEPTGRLAEILVLDQFSRHVHRGEPRAFAQDALALGLAQTAVALGADQALPPAQRAFLYMPYMHSESPLIHAEALRLFGAPGLERQLEAERRHWAVIERFGRYPHRNAALGRASTPEERAFIATPGTAF
jgi:uncharacterized protein (DUF924 family)